MSEEPNRAQEGAPGVGDLFAAAAGWISGNRIVVMLCGAGAAVFTLAIYQLFGDRYGEVTDYVAHAMHSSALKPVDQSGRWVLFLESGQSRTIVPALAFWFLLGFLVAVVAGFVRGAGVGAALDVAARLPATFRIVLRIGERRRAATFLFGVAAALLFHSVWRQSWPGLAALFSACLLALALPGLAGCVRISLGRLRHNLGGGSLSFPSLASVQLFFLGALLAFLLVFLIPAVGFHYKLVLLLVLLGIAVAAAGRQPRDNAAATAMQVLLLLTLLPTEALAQSGADGGNAGDQNSLLRFNAEAFIESLLPAFVCFLGTGLGLGLGQVLGGWAAAASESRDGDGPSGGSGAGVALLVLGVGLLAAGETHGQVTNENLLGKWKTPGGSIVEIRPGGGGLEGYIVEPSEQAAAKGVQVGDLELRKVRPDGLGVAFEVAWRHETERETIEWLPSSGGRIEQGVITGNVRIGNWGEDEFVPGETVEYPLRPRCPVLDGSLSLGQFDGAELFVELSEPLKEEEQPEGAKEEGLCVLSELVVGSVSIRTGGLPGGSGTFRIGPKIEGCSVNVIWEEYTDPRREKGARVVWLSWTDDGTSTYPVIEYERLGLSLIVYSFGAVFVLDEEDNISMENAFVTLQIDVDGPSKVYGPVYLAGEMSGLITYSWKRNARSWTDGEWDFGGAANLQLQVVQRNSVPLAVMDLAFNSEGEMEGELRLFLEGPIEMFGFAVEFTECSLRAAASLKNGTLELLGGALEGSLTTPEPLAGRFGFVMAWDPATRLFSMKVSAESEVEAFGGTLREFSLGFDLNPDTLEFTRIEGSLAYDHKSSDFDLRIESFLVEKGELKEFIGRGSVRYRNVAMTVSLLEYKTAAEDRAAYLAVSAALDLGWGTTGTGSVEVTGLTIRENGEITNFSIRAHVSAAPVDVRFSATYDAGKSEFAGEFSGTFAAAEFGGTVVVGQESNYRYGFLRVYFELPTGVPIGNTGLKLLGMNGAFGCKYRPPPLGETGPGAPEPDTYHIEVGVTIGDAIGLAKLNGTVALTLGESSAVGISGRLQITEGTPYFVGQLSCNYTLGSGEVSGSIRCSVKIPESGSVVSINENTLHYRMSGTDYALNGAGLGGRFFQIVELRDGHINLRGRTAEPIDSMTGGLGGRLVGRTVMRYAYPSDFSCSSEDYNFGVVANFRAEIEGMLDARLGREGTSGTFRLSVVLEGGGSLRLRSSWFGGIDCASVGLTASGVLDASNERGSLRVTGTITVSDSSGWLSKDLSVSHVF